MSKKVRRYLIFAPIVACFLVLGWVTTTSALSVFGRTVGNWWGSWGYFYNQYAGCPTLVQDDVIPYGIPTSVRDADSFINQILNFLYSPSYPQQYHTSAAFIIHTMIGTGLNGGGNRAKPPTAAQIADWEARVRYADAKGWVSWGKTFTYQLNSCYQRSNDDDMFWWESSPKVTTAGGGIEFHDASGNVVYQIQYSCGNPLGTVAALPTAPSYTITGRTTVSSATVYPGQTVTFKHYLKNSGPDSATIGWSTKDGNTNATTGIGSSAIVGGREVNARNETVTVPTNAAFGSRYCRYISFSPAQNGIGSGNGSTVCAQVVANFSLTPIVTPSAPTAQQNDLVTFTYAITVSGPTRSAIVSCKSAGQTHSAGYTPLPQQDSDRNPPVMPQPAFACNNELPTGTTQVATEIVDMANAPTGSSVCRSLVVNPKNQAGGFRSSAEACVVIAKTPYVQFMGNDVWAGGGFAAVTPLCNALSKIQTVAHTLKDGTVAGSAVEYAAFALGKITNFGSANKALVSSAGPIGKQLTFSNINTSNLGNFAAPQHCINDYVAAYTKTTKDPIPGGSSINLATRPSGTQLDIVSASPISFSGTMAAGSQQVYLIEGDVTITGDIKYPATYAGLNGIPSLVIIATGTMTVSRNVQQMDGIFVARGNFYTCDVPVTTTLSINPPCEKQLSINGSVSAGKLRLLRTFGGDGANDTQRKRPAELFNFNAELYLRDALNGANPNIMRTINEQDLPPRF